VNGAISCIITFASNASDSLQTIIFAASAAALAAIALAPIFSRIPLVAASVLPLLASHFVFWQSNHSTLALLVLSGVTIPFALAVANACKGSLQKRSAIPEFILLSLLIVSLYAYLFSGYSTHS